MKDITNQNSSNARIGIVMACCQPKIIVGPTHYNFSNYNIDINDWYNLSEIELPDSVEDLSSGSFYKTNLKSIKINKGLKKIGHLVFMLTPIKYIEIPKTVEFVSEHAFSYAYSLETVKLPKKFKNINFIVNVPVKFEYY